MGVDKLQAMDQVELAKLCKRNGLHPGSNSKDELIARLVDAGVVKPKKSAED